MQLAHCTLLITQLLYVCADKEYMSHGQHHPVHEEHYPDGRHNAEFDHEAVLGSHRANEEFAELPPHEAKKRLATMVDRMDQDKDGYISQEELSNWLTKSFVQLNREEAISKMQTQDLNNDTEVTWTEYLSSVYGYEPDELYDMEKDKNPQIQMFVRMVQDDRERFQRADVNKDGVLDQDEYAAFLHPLDYPHMQEYELDRLIADYDKNHDNFVDFQEYMGETPGSIETQIIDKENFNNYDTNKDGQLSRHEVRAWMIPDMTQSVSQEVEHLFSMTDLDHDNRLTKQEILDQHLLWVGSAATDYGNDLRHHDPQEL